MSLLKSDGYKPSKKQFGTLFALCLLIVGALLRPYWGSQVINYKGAGVHIMATLDISRSMLVADVNPNRLELAKRKLLDLVRYAEKNAPSTQIGIVLFAGSAYLYCPATSDFSVIRTYINSITTDLIQDRGSDITSAIAEARGAIGEKNGSILILSDGEDLSFDEAQLRSLLTGTEIHISAISFGTEKGAPVPERNGGFIRDQNNAVVISKRTDETLSQIAEETEGSFSVASTNDSDIEPLFHTETVTTTESVVQKNEFGFAFLILALTLLCGALWRGVFIALIFFAVPPMSVSAESSKESYEGGAAYRQEQFSKAVEDFEKAAKEDPENPDVLQGLGSSQFKAGDLKAAEKSFEQLDTLAKKPTQQFDARYNLGNTFLAAKNYKDAIASYDKALAVNPDDIRAKTNREIAQELLKQQQQQQQQNQDQNQDKENQQDQNQQNSSNTQQNRDSKQQEQQQNQSQDQSREDNSQKDPQQTQGKESSNQDRDPRREERQHLSQDQQTAERWLDSLPESPVALRRKNGRKSSVEGQSW